MVAAAFESWLRKADGFRHSRSRPVYLHLKGVYDLLRDWGNPDIVCLAGLYHNVYGTRYYQQQVLSKRNRDVLRKLIGAEAEELAFRFCTETRESQRDPQLLEIEAANLIEQHGLSAWWRAKLLDSEISGAAKLAIECNGKL